MSRSAENPPATPTATPVLIHGLLLESMAERRAPDHQADDAGGLLREREDADEGGGDEDLPGFSGWTRQGTPIQEF